MPSRRFLTSCWTLVTDLLNMYLCKLYQLKGPSAISTPTSAHPQCCQGKKYMRFCVDYETFLSAIVSLSQKVLHCKASISFLLLYQNSGNRMEVTSRPTFSCLKQLRLDLFSDLLSFLGSLSSCFPGQQIPKIYIFWTSNSPLNLMGRIRILGKVGKISYVFSHTSPLGTHRYPINRTACYCLLSFL